MRLNIICLKVYSLKTPFFSKKWNLLKFRFRFKISDIFKQINNNLEEENKLKQQKPENTGILVVFMHHYINPWTCTLLTWILKFVLLTMKNVHNKLCVYLPQLFKFGCTTSQKPQPTKKNCNNLSKVFKGE